MKHKIIFLAFISFAVVFFSSCKKNYLTRTPYTAVPLSTAVNSEADLSVALNGVYAAMRNTDLFGRTLPVKGDLQADNTFVTTSNSNRYITMNNFTMTAVTTDYGGLVWNAAYVVIKNANKMLNAAAGVASSTNVTQYTGEAYAIRALMYFELIRNFAHPFTAAPNDPGVPILPQDQSYDPAAATSFKPSRSLVKDVYTAIIADLEKAYAMMSVYRGTAYFSKYAARALEAKVYQTMGDWTDAKTVSLDVINNSGWVLLSPTGYVSVAGTLGGTSAASALNSYTPGGYWANPAPQTTTKNETFFEVTSDLLANNGFDQLGFIYLQVGGGYGDLLGTDDLYSQYSATDVRLGLIPRAPAGYRSGQAGNVNLCYKYPNPANPADRDDYKVVRLSDVLLIAAEAYYNASDYTNANIYLNKVAQQRDPAFVAGYSHTGAQVLEDILTERRKELAFEGDRLYDLIRLGRSWTKVKNQNPLGTIAVLPSNYELIFPIPQGERDANPNVSQNPSY